MPAPRSSSSGRSGGSGSRKSAGRSGGAKRGSAGGTKRSGSTAAKSTASKARSSSSRASSTKSAAGARSARADSRQNTTGTSDQVATSLIKPLDLVLISRERIQQTLDEAAERGRVTRADANELVVELVKRGQKQTDDLVREVERLVGRGRDQLGSASRRVRSTEPVDRIVRSADRARRTMGVGPPFPILGYDELTAGQVDQRLTGLKPVELRKVRDYERRHANRKSVLDAIERALA